MNRSSALPARPEADAADAEDVPPEADDFCCKNREQTNEMIGVCSLLFLSFFYFRLSFCFQPCPPYFPLFTGIPLKSSAISGVTLFLISNPPTPTWFSVLMVQ